MSSDELKAAKADAKAEKAREKALRPWYKKKRFVVPLAVVAVMVIAGVASGGGDGSDVASDSGQQQSTTESEQEAASGGDDGSDLTVESGQEQSLGEGEQEAERVGLNEAVRDGKFEFTVTGFRCGEASVGDEFFTEEAQGQFCLLGLRVENIGDEAQSLFAEAQLLIDDQGREFSADSMATISHNPEGDAFWSEINPGNSIEGEIVFDVSEGANLAEAQLHDSLFSEGVRVSLP